MARQLIVKDIPCKKLPNIDTLSSKLKGVIPSLNVGIPAKIKEFNISKAFNAALPDISALVSGVTENLKNIKIGKLPKLDFKDLDPSKLFKKLDLDSIKSMNLAAKASDLIKKEADAFANKLLGQIDCIDTDVINSDELTSMQGDLMSSISDKTSQLTNMQLREFNNPLSTEFDKIVSLNTSDVIEAQKAKVLKGISNKEIVSKQSDTLKKLLS
jgi:hypothetical protein